MKMALMFKWILYCSHLTALKKIEQRFFVRGHTYNSCDRCFIAIENANRKSSKELFVPDDWFNLIQNTKKADPKFQVLKMESNHFYSFSTLLNGIHSEKMSTDGKKN